MAGAYPASDYPKTITITTTSSGAVMRYTKDNSTPSESNGTLINGTSGTANVGSGITLKAIAYGSNYADSAIASGAYTTAAKVAKPTFAPVAGAYNSADYPKTITLKTTTSGAVMRYTKDGSAPSESHGTLINGTSGTVNVGSGITLKAIAYKSGLSDSDIASGKYSALPAAATPTLNPTGYDGCDETVLVTLSTTTSGASLSYTVDGSTPTPNNGTIIHASSGTITQLVPSRGGSAPPPLEVMAFKSGLSDSGVASGIYQRGSGCPPPPNGPETKAGEENPAPVAGGASALREAAARSDDLGGERALSGVEQGLGNGLVRGAEPARVGGQAQRLRGLSSLDGFMRVSYREPARAAGRGGGGWDPNTLSSTPTYDGNGNLTTGLDGSTYLYDAMNRLISATLNGVTETFAYDGLNRQVARTLSGATTYSVYDGWNLVAEYSGSTTASRAWVYGATGMIKELVSGNYYYQDGLGSTSHLADSTGALLEWYRYDLQGAPIYYDANNNPIDDSAHGIKHLYTGQRWYSALGLYDLRNRYYSPDIGRFLQPDPIGFGGDASNLYRYGGNNPVNRNDPSGLGFWSWLKALLRTINGTAPSQSPNSNPGSANNGNSVTHYGRIPTGSHIPSTDTETANGNFWDVSTHDVINGTRELGTFALISLPSQGISNAVYVPASAIQRVMLLALDTTYSDNGEGNPNGVYFTHFGRTPRAGGWDSDGDSGTDAGHGGVDPATDTYIMLNGNSLAISKNVADAHGLAYHDPVFANGQYIGNYDDRAPESGRIDVWDPTNAVRNRNWGGMLWGADISNHR